MKKLITILDWYIIKRMMVTFIFTLFMFNIIGVVFDYIEHVDDFIKREAPNKEILLFLGSFFPWITGILSHLFLFIAVIFFTSKMANQSEVVAMLASGMSFNRFLRPYMLASAVIFIVLMFANHYWIPTSNKTRFRIQDKYLFLAEKVSQNNKHVRIGPRTYAYTEYFDKGRNRASRLTFETFDSLGELKQTISSISASYDSLKNEWVMNNVAIINYIGKNQDIEYRDNYINKWDLMPDDFFEEKRPREEYTSPELEKSIAKSKRLGLDSYNFLYVELYRRTAQSFAVFIFVLIGACIASVKIRGGSGLHLAMGIFICLVYVFLQQMVIALSTKGNLPPLLAVWIPNIIFSFVALYFYKRRVK